MVVTDSHVTLHGVTHLLVPRARPFRDVSRATIAGIAFTMGTLLLQFPRGCCCCSHRPFSALSIRQRTIRGRGNRGKLSACKRLGAVFRRELRGRRREEVASGVASTAIV